MVACAVYGTFHLIINISIILVLYLQFVYISVIRQPHSCLHTDV